MTCLFLDDERDPPDDGRNWIIARDFSTARDIIMENGISEFMSLDHDLGAGETGYDFVKWLCDYVLDGHAKFPEGFSFYVHSQNPVGRANIDNYLNAFLGQNDQYFR